MHPSNPKNRALYREADGFLLVVEGVWQPWHCRFTVAEQLYDSAAPEPVRAPSTAESEPAEPTDATPRAHEPGPGPGPQPAWDAGVPEVPSWLGRDGLP